jgi:hypothetical protein
MVVSLFIVADVKTKQVEQLTNYDNGVNSFDIVNNKLVFVKTEVADSHLKYILPMLRQKNAKRISSFNYDWVQNNSFLSAKKVFTNSKERHRILDHEAGKL